MTSVRSVLLDVEGTTTPISFVKDVLFPFVRTNAAAFLAAHRESPEVRHDLRRLRAERAAEPAEAGAPEWSDAAEGEERAALAYVLWLMERDRKSTGLKSLQGKVWEHGYESGALVAPVYPDVPPALRRLRDQGVDVSIFSSGSVLAQHLLFAHTDAGDLRPLLTAYFDTTTGAKREAASYTRIGEALSRPPAEVLFVSDIEEELHAARTAGLQTALCIRPGAPEPAPSWHVTIRSFEEVCP